MRAAFILMSRSTTLSWVILLTTEFFLSVFPIYLIKTGFYRLQTHRRGAHRIFFFDPFLKGNWNFGQRGQYGLPWH